jgi:hypothetical protein
LVLLLLVASSLRGADVADGGGGGGGGGSGRCGVKSSSPSDMSMLGECHAQG